MHNSRLLHINSLAKTWLLLSCVALFALGLRAQNPGDIQGVFEVDRTKPVGESYGVGETFDLAVRIYGANVASVIASPSGGYPRLQLDHKQTGIDLKADKKYAKYLEFEDNYLYFRYTVQPGDFAVDLNAIGFDFNGATINLDGGLGILGRSNAREMPTTGPYSLQEQSDISIRTIGFIGQADPLNMTAAVQVDASLAIPVTRTLADALQIPFIVTAVPASAVPDNFTCSPATFVIPANNTDGTLTLSGVAPTATPVTLRLHPSDYGTETAGDLLVTVNISSPSSQYYTVEVEKSTVDEGETVTCTVNLTQPAPAGGLNITLTNAPTAGTPVTYTGGNLVVFPAGATSVSKQITFNGGVSPVFIGGSSSLPHYSMMAGSLVNVRTVLPTFTIEGSASGLTEGQDYSFYVHLSKPATTQLTITLTSDNPSALTFNGPGVVVFPAGEVSRPYFVKALDGGTTVANGSTATISGTCSDPTYSMASPGFLTLINIPPTITSPVSTPENPWEPTPGSEGFLYPFSWSAIDVDADLGKLEGRVSFGDGTFSPWIQGADGIVSHIYNTPGSYAVTITVRDTDGGTATVGGTLVIESATRLLINEHKINDDNANPYKGLSGLGWGTVDDNDPATTRTVVNPNYDWEIKYDPNQNGATLIATPERGAILGTNEVDMLDSFFHVWVGDGFVSPAAITPIAPRTSMVGLSGGDGGTPQQVGGVFSREFYDEDGCGDIDHDELPDEWEISFGLDCESPAGDNGRMGNPDGDFLPRGAGENLSYPAAGNNYTPDGRAFGNVYEVRGFDPGLNGDLSRLPLGSASGPEDEPRYGEYDADNNFTSTDTRKFYGTDPTNPDTDGDGRDDGWEYYFWMNAKVREITGSRYSPSQVVLGTTITSAEIVRAFDPLTPGAADLDTDGDGLSDLEEYVLGTNPIHWDTDGDGMNDGWEVANGLDPFSNDGGLNPDRDWMAYDELNDLRHWQVYDYYGFDPRVGWHDTYLDKDREIRRFTPTTAPFTNYEEYYLGRVAIESGFTGAVPAGGGRWMTNPNNPDSDGDDLPDGWELYVSCGPNSAPVMWPIGPDASLDAGYDFDGDGLTNLEEFHALETCDVVYSTGVVDHQAGTVTFTTHQINNVNARWWNKFWATDPHNEDTDGDSVSDGDERRFFQYDNGYAGYIRGSRPGGMLNPCSVDTDMDFIPDGWEMHFAGEETATGMINGMDGTYFDSKSGLDPITGEWRNFDYDGDGLENYQEYWLNAVAHLQYDAWTPGLGYGAYDPAAFFTGVPYEWDWAFWANYWQRGESPPDVPYRFMEPGLRPFGPYDGLVAYATTDPRNPDSDEDGMDDYYEMFHGLNPLLSLTVNIVGTRPIAEVVDPGAGFAVYDFRLQPWLAGTPNADPDQDGIPNWEEALIPNRPAPYNHHTDPSPLWFTDTSYANSFVNLYYNLGSVPMYWGEGPGVDLDIAALAENMVLQRPYYMFDFEVNEGYDTDNDNIMDKQEIIGTTVAGVTDPLDMESPLQRKALYLDGNAAARTRIGFAHGPSALRSWTLEVWVRPENPASGKRQVILERPVWVWDSDPMPKGGDVRRNFRLGLEWDGTPFVEYENSGSQGQTEKAHGQGWPLAANEWTHLAATMSGVDKKLRLFVDGELLQSVDTTSIPVTGIIDGTMDDESFTFVYSGAPLVVGAADANPLGSVNGGYIYINGDIYGGPSQPALSSYYKGWLDEIRIWDGARTQSELVGDFNSRKRYMRSDVIASREAAVAQYNAILAARGLELPTAGYTFDEYFDDAADAVIRSGGETSASRLPPMLLYHYSFDNLPDPSYEPRVPGSFSQLNGRPTVDYPGIPWWHQAADRSTVYRTFDANPYLFVQWIENTVATLPLGVLTDDGRFDPIRSVDSIFYQRHSTGHTVLSNGYENAFNNTANPYNMVYRHGDSDDSQTDIEDIPATFDPMFHGQFNHLLPLRGAVADMRVPLWDKAGTPGYDDLFDSDGDGIPDWWEVAHGLNPFDPADGDLDPDGDGLSNYWEYRLGTDPHGVYSTDPAVPDGDLDFDGDGLTNYEELNFYGTDPTNPDTDNDGLSDKLEVDMGLSPVDSLSPLVLRYIRNDGTGHIAVPGAIPTVDPDGYRLDLDEWTIEATVRLLAEPLDDIILISRATEPKGYLNYELGIAADRIPYVRFHSQGGSEYRVNGVRPIPLNEWTCLGGRFGEDERGTEMVRQLALFENSVRTVRDVTSIRPVSGSTRGNLILAQNLNGDIDEVRIWKYSRADQEIIDAHGKKLLFGSDVARMGSLRTITEVGEGHFHVDDRESLRLADNWTLESWIKVASPGVILERPIGVALDGQQIYNYRLTIPADGRVQASFDFEATLYFWTEVVTGTWAWQARNRWGEIRLNTINSIIDDEWHHISFVLDSNTQAVRLYLDGKLEDVVPLWPNIRSIYWHLGGDDDDSYLRRGYDFIRFATESGNIALGQGVDGLIDEVRFYSKALTLIEIERTKDTKANLVEELVAYFDFDDIDPRTLPVVKDAADEENSGELREGAELALELGDNAPIAFNVLDILRPKLAAYFPLDDGRNLHDEGISCVEDFVHALSLDYKNHIYAGSLLPGTNSIDYLSYWGFSIGDYSDPMAYPENISPAHPDSPFRSFPLPPDSPWRLDSDGDGMPDIFEVYYGLDPNREIPPERPELGPFGDMDGDGLYNLYEYYAGTDPTFWDSTGTGVPDADIDSDGDGISNLDEQLIGTHPGRIDTDDDGFTDYEEVFRNSALPEYLYWSNAADSMDPKDPANPAATDPRLRFKSMKLDGQRHEIPRPLTDRRRFNAAAWTLEAWVWFDAAQAHGSLIQYVGEQWNNGVASQLKFYELGLNNGYPYVTFQGSANLQHLFTAHQPLPLGRWVHLAAVFDPERDTLELYQDGNQVAALQVFDSALSQSQTAQNFPGRAYIGADELFGNIDEVRIWSVARTSAQIANGMFNLVQLNEPGQITNFRFDDGGEHAEDFAHRLQPDDLETMHLYALRGITFDSDRAVLQTAFDFDDADGDGLPDWWENRYFNEIMTYYRPRRSSFSRLVGSTPATTRLVGAMDKSFNAYYLGWGVDFTPLETLPGRRWTSQPDTAWMFRDFELTDSDQAIEIRMAAAPLPRTRLFLNGVEIDLASAEVVSPATVVDLDRVPSVSLFQTFYLPATLFTTNQVVGRNRLAIEMQNLEDWTTADDITDEYFTLNLVVDGQTHLIQHGGATGIGSRDKARWWVYAKPGSTVPPPLDHQGREWFDPDYAIDTDGDPDYDELPNWFEYAAGTNPRAVDTDGDGIHDTHEDPDSDGLPNYLEYLYGTDPRLPDTDDDGILDGLDPVPANALAPFVDRLLSLDGDPESYVAAPNNQRWATGDNSFTVVAWINPASLPASQATIIERLVSLDTFNYRLALNSDGQVVAEMSTLSGSSSTLVAAVPVAQFNLTPLNWVHLALVYSRTSELLSLHLNGHQVASAQLRNLPAWSSAGALHTRIGSGFNGYIDEVALYGRALTPNELQHLAGRSIDTLNDYDADLQAYFRFDDGTSWQPGADPGTSAMLGRAGGQVQDFAFLFWDADTRKLRELDQTDWRRNWRNAGTLHGGALIANAGGAGGIPFAPVTVAGRDSDGDGLPDDFELAYGMDPFNPDEDGNGVLDGWDDWDFDGLSNYAEWRAGTHPENYDSNNNGINDYEDVKAGSARILGVRFTDNDHLEDHWEALFSDAFASPWRYDEHYDRDGDGWDNWSEARASFADGRIYRPDRQYSYRLLATDEDGTEEWETIPEYPQPDLLVTVDYQGVKDLRVGQAALIIHAYTDQYMNGMPDVVYNVELTTPVAWPLNLRVTTNNITYGHLRQGKNWFYAFIDLDGSTLASMDAAIDWRTWTPGEPAAIADGHADGIEIGWDRNEVRFGLTDEAKSFARFSWADTPYADAAVNRVAILSATGTELFVREIKAPRTWIHEGDLIAGRIQQFGLGWGSVYPPQHLFTCRLNGDSSSDRSLTNRYMATLTVPVLLDPKGDAHTYAYGELIEFRFRLASEATEFDFELRRGSAGGTIVYSGRHLAPSRQSFNNQDDHIVWRFPRFVGSTISSGQLFSDGTYYWRVRAYSPAATSGSAWSTAANFLVAQSATLPPNGAKSWLSVKVRYPGGAYALANGNKITVQAFRSASFNGLPDGEIDIAGVVGSDPLDHAYVGTATIAGLKTGESYYLRAFVDQNNNRRRANWETWGYYRNPQDPVMPFQPLAVVALANGTTAPLAITLRDADTDNDNLPDSLENNMHGAGGGDWLAQAGPQANALGFSDFNANGISDFEELDLGNDPLALAPPPVAEPTLDPLGSELKLKLTGFDPASNRLSWRLLDPSEPQRLGKDEPELLPLSRSVRYEIEFATSLTQRAWEPLTNFSSSESGADIDLPHVEGPSGFYRVKMLATE